MNYYIVNLYFETKQPLYNPISAESNKFSGTIFVPLTPEQYQKFITYINLNNFSTNFERLIVLNTEQASLFFYQFAIRLINKNNYIINNQCLPMYYIIQFIETII